jgi:hypothetical protein
MDGPQGRNLGQADLCSFMCHQESGTDNSMPAHNLGQPLSTAKDWPQSVKPLLDPSCDEFSEVLMSNNAMMRLNM